MVSRPTLADVPLAPALGPGLIAPPAVTVTGAEIVPVPPSTLPLFCTVTRPVPLLVRLTSNVPALTAVSPV